MEILDVLPGEINPPPHNNHYKTDTEIANAGPAPYIDRIFVSYNQEGQTMRVSFCESWADPQGSGMEFRQAVTVTEAGLRSIIDMFHDLMNKIDVSKGFGEKNYPRCSLAPMTPVNTKPM